MIFVLRKVMKKMTIFSVLILAMTMQYESEALAAEATVPTIEGSVSGNKVADDAMADAAVSDNSVPAADEMEAAPSPKTEEENAGAAAGIAEAEKSAASSEEAAKEEALSGKTAAEKQVISSTQMQTINYKDLILTDWQQIIEALSTLSPEALTDGGAGGTLVLQMQNVSDIPAGIKDGLAAGDSGYAKALHCNVGYGVSLVFNSNTDNSGFGGISNASATVTSEKRGKRSMATTVRFGSHENLGTVASLQVNLPQCEEGTKVSVYAETVSVDAAGNVILGENVCIGNTKADENGNVEVPIQSMANYMFVYKAAKE